MLKKKFFKTKDECEVTFELATAESQTAFVVCEVNDWEPVAMTKAKKAGSPFRLKMRLPKGGEFQFRYKLDGDMWLNDDSADAYRPNEYGGENSVVFTSEA